jgi:tripartite-type tricarboxylate transporter receptor subunit TctC
MKRSRRQFLRLAAVAAALPAAARSATAQAYPSRPITMIVPFPAGGPNDTIARLLAEGMRPPLGQPIIIENVGGAAGSIGVGRAARAAPDGHTLILGNWGTHVVNGAIYTLGYDVLGDFAPIAVVASNPAFILARNAVPADDLRTLIAWVKANGDKTTFGVPGVGSAPHIYGALFQSFSGTRLQFIPYRGGAQVIQDLSAGQIDMAITTPVVSLAAIRAGQVKAYAVTARSRVAAAPDIPSVDEAGLPGYYTSNWTALWAPKATPSDVLAKVNAAVVEALAEPTVRARLAGPGQDIPPRQQQTPEGLAALHKAEIEKWWPIISQANIKAQ